MQAKTPFSETWFYRRILNNKWVTNTLIFLLGLLVLWVISKLSYLLKPIVLFLEVIGLPTIFSGLLYYLFVPVVDYFEQKWRIKRIWAITLLFILIFSLLIWGFIVVIPKLSVQFQSFIKAVPEYWNILEERLNNWMNQDTWRSYAPKLDESVKTFFITIGKMVRSLSKNAFQGIGSVVGAVTQVVVAVLLTPFLLFYLLKDGKKLPKSVIHMLPNKMRVPTHTILKDINTQLSQYVRGQLTVAFAVTILFMIGFNIIRLDYAFTLAILAGFLNLVPYLGSFFAMIPAVLLGLIGGPVLLIQVLIVFALEQLIEGKVISPLVLGSQLDIHPVTIIFILLTAGKLFGVMGVILGIPVYAAIKVIVVHLFRWYKEVSPLYYEEE